MQKTPLIIAMPVYNDWQSLSVLLERIDRVVREQGLRPIITIIDDGSTLPNDCLLDTARRLENISRILILRLARNLGHQKAIAIGLAYINANLKCSQLIVMDSDGEDRPEDIALLLDEHRQSPHAVIFAHRKTRSEGAIFRIFYAIYKFVFRILTGARISFGNFALIPAPLLKQLVFLPEIWNHFAAGILHSKLPWKIVPTNRGVRYAGKSKMNFISLVIHGLSAISVYIEILTARLILLSLTIITLDFLGLIAVVCVKYLTSLAIPGWATYTAIGLAVIMFQAFLFLLLLSFVVLSYRTSKLFVPAKDYQDYFWGVDRIL